MNILKLSQHSSSLKERFLVFTLLAMSLGGIFYYFWEVNMLTSIGAIGLSSILAFTNIRKLSFHLQSIHKLEFIAIIIDLFLLSILIIQRTDEFMTSPWQAVSWWFFVLYAISSALIIFVSQKKTLSTLTTSIHLFFAYSIAAILYKLGFGFDGFIHRATETHILEYGFIEPKQPFYLGQYALIPMLAKLSSLSVFSLDVFFVPVLTALFLPLAFTKKETPFVFLVPFLFPITLNLTTPHNIVLLLTILGVAFAKKHLFPLAFLASFVALITHPLPGAPLFIFVLGSYLSHRYTKKSIPAIIALLIAIIPTILFSIHQYLSGFGLPTFSNPLQKMDLFLQHFSRPYWYLDNAGFLLDTLYAWQATIIPLFVCICLYGMKKNWNTASKLSLATAIGLFISAFILQTSIYFYGVASYEQGNYPARLLLLSLLYLLPNAPAGISHLWKLVSNKIPNHKQTLQIGSAGMCGALLMFSLYFSYPQTNHKARFPGHNVTKYDVKTVQTIHELQNNDQEFIVLSNALTSVAALTEYGFSHHVDTAEGEQFYYAIPTGGPLYAYFGDMLYKGQKRETMLNAMNFAHVNTAYFVVHDYWGNSKAIQEGARNTADEEISIDNKITIFVYKR